MTDTRRDWVTTLGVTAVAASAAVLTFSAWRALAETCGITGWQSWLVPVTVDAAGLVAARVWLGGRAPDDAVRVGRALTLGCIALSIAGNAGQHGMAAYGIAVPWWVVVVVSAVPPAMLGTLGGLVHLLRTTTTTTLATAVDDLATDNHQDNQDNHQLVDDNHQDNQPGDDLTSRARQLVDAGAGRARLAKELEITDHRARQLLAEVRSNNGSTP